jgi:hypothetical protein
MGKFRLLQLPFLLLALISYASAQYARTDHKLIVDAAGNPLLLRATNLGNWLVPEGYMWLFEGGPQSPVRSLRVRSVRWCWSCLDLKGQPHSGRNTARTTLRMRTSPSCIGPASTPFEFLCITASLRATTRKVSSCWTG